MTRRASAAIYLRAANGTRLGAQAFDTDQEAFESMHELQVRTLTRAVPAAMRMHPVPYSHMVEHVWEFDLVLTGDTEPDRVVMRAEVRTAPVFTGSRGTSAS